MMNWPPQGKCFSESYIMRSHRLQHWISCDMWCTCRRWVKHPAASNFRASHLHHQRQSITHTGPTLQFRSDWAMLVIWLQPTGVGSSKVECSPPFWRIHTLVAPAHVLLIISCGCTAVCGKRCKCRKEGLYCTPMCSSCIGQTCINVCKPDEEHEASVSITWLFH